MRPEPQHWFRWFHLILRPMIRILSSKKYPILWIRFRIPNKVKNNKKLVTNHQCLDLTGLPVCLRAWAGPGWRLSCASWWRSCWFPPQSWSPPWTGSPARSSSSWSSQPIRPYDWSKPRNPSFSNLEDPSCSNPPNPSWSSPPRPSSFLPPYCCTLYRYSGGYLTQQIAVQCSGLSAHCTIYLFNVLDCLYTVLG